MLLAARYGSDVIVDLLKGFGIQYAALNPGATYRGLHDSIVNYRGNKPEIVTCTHEEIAVAIAHGYTKVTGKPMAAIVHDVVGLLHASMAIYYAHIDRAPVLVLGATGPLDRSKRRPYIDWIHSALVQGNAVRDFVKWDDQPASVAAEIAAARPTALQADPEALEHAAHLIAHAERPVIVAEFAGRHPVA